MQKYKKNIAIAFAAVSITFYVWHKRSAFAQILSVLFLSCVFSLLLAPICNFLENKRISPGAAVIVVLSVFMLAALFSLSLFIPLLLTRTASLLQRNIPTLLSILDDMRTFLNSAGLANLSANTDSLSVSSLSAATTLLARIGSSIASTAGRLVFAFVITYYPLRERKNLVRHVLLCMPPTWRMPFLSAFQACKTSLSGYLSGVFKTSLFISAATWIGLIILGIKDAALLAFFMGLFELLPYIGPVLASIPILLSALEQGTQQALLALALVVSVQQIESYFVSPYFAASSTSLHPFTALLSVFIFGNLMGVWGMLLAIPMVITLRSILWSLRQVNR